MDLESLVLSDTFFLLCPVTHLAVKEEDYSLSLLSLSFNS
jgi:hypothetical protein